MTCRCTGRDTVGGDGGLSVRGSVTLRAGWGMFTLGDAGGTVTLRDAGGIVTRRGGGGIVLTAGCGGMMKEPSLSLHSQSSLPHNLQSEQSHHHPCA